MDEIKPVYDSSLLKPSFIEEFLCLLRYRGLIPRLISRIITTRYKRSVLGLGWTMLNPLLTMIVMTIVFSALFSNSIDNYPIYLLSGLFTWNFFVNSTSNSMSEMLAGAIMSQRIYLPRSIFVFAAIGAELVNMLIAFIPLIIIMLFTGAKIGPALFVLPFSILLLLIFASGIGLILATIVLFFTDIVQIYNVLLMILMYSSPIMYPREIIPEKWRVMLWINPFTYMLDIIRPPIYNGIIPGPQAFLVSFLIAFITFLIGWFVFTSKVKEYAYRS